LFIFWRCRCTPWTPRLPALFIAPSWFVHCRVPPPVPPHLGALCIMLLVRRILSTSWKILLFLKASLIFPRIMGS
jgi:hypothetical protein